MKTVEVTAEDLVALIAHYHALHKSITPDMFDQPNMTGGTMREVAAHYLRKRMHFQQILNGLTQ